MEINSSNENHEKPKLKITRTEQIPELCKKIMYLLTKKEYIFTTKYNTKKTLLKLLNINSKEKHCGVNKVMSVFYVNNLTLSIINIKYTIFMHIHCVNSTI